MTAMREAFRFSIRIALVLVVTGAIALTLIGVPRLLSDDECLRTSEVDCTTAGGFLQTLDVLGVLSGLLAVRVLPIILAIAIANEAVQYGSDRRRRARRSARRVGEEPGSKGRGGRAERPART